MHTWELSGDDDLRLIQECAARLWSPSSWWHPGGLAWEGESITHRETSQVLLIGSPGALIAWAWLELPGHLNAQIDPAHASLASRIVTWFVDNATADLLTASVPDGNDTLRVAVQAEGFAEVEGAPYFLDMRQRARRPPVQRRVATASARVTPADFAARVRLHQAAWEPGRLPFHPDHPPDIANDAENPFSEDSYRRVQAAPTYRPELDLVAVAPDGSLAASCIAWLDDRIRVAEIEPVGTDPDHRRRGLAGALCLAAIDKVSELGGTEVAIHARGDEAYPVPRLVYGRCGFSVTNRTRTYGRAGR